VMFPSTMAQMVRCCDVMPPHTITDTFGFHQLCDKRLGRLIRFFCGLLGVNGGRFLSMISSTAHPRYCYGHHLGFGFRRLEDKHLGPLIQSFCGLLEVIRGRVISMISSATHPRWPLRLSSWIWFPLIRRQTPGSIDPIFLWLIIGVTRGRFLLMISSTAHPIWPPCGNLGFGFRRFEDKCLGRLIRFFCGLSG
jgi:hypothetical protein